MCSRININALKEVKVRKYERFLSCIFRIVFVKKDWGYLQKTLMAGFKDGGELIVPVYL